MLKATLHNGELRITAEEELEGYLKTHTMVRLTGPFGSVSRSVPIEGAVATGDRLRIHGLANGFFVEQVWTPREGSRCRYFDVEMSVHHFGEEPDTCGLQVRFELTGGEPSWWMVPGLFYGENRLANCHVRYPRYVPGGGDLAEIESDYWAFRADRAAVPAVFGWTADLCAAVATSETSDAGLSGVGLSGRHNRAAVWLDFPYREEPLTYTAYKHADGPDCPLYTWQPGQEARFSFRVYLSRPEPHAYDPFVRELYGLDQGPNPLNPWMGLKQAAELTAHGLYRWHYKPESQVLYETIAFDRELSGGRGVGDRPNMHVAWVSGAPYAYALLTHGRTRGRTDYVDGAVGVLDKIAGGIAPCGAFWGEWRGDRGWSCGWTPNKQWLQARTLSEATLFMARALRAERERGIDHPNWAEAVLSNLRFAAAHQREDGSYGSYYHCETGEVVEWEGAGGILWIAALVEGAALFGENAWRESAARAGAYYRRFIEGELIYGAPEDVHLTPTSEDGYNAVVAYVLLYEADRRNDWLRLARAAAEWTMTFRWTYNIAFPEHTMLKVYDFRSRGADLASPSNQHLHNYGLFCLPEMLRLWSYTGDSYYLERTRDNLACFLQFIARSDGDFNAYKGMVTERYYNTNCFQPKGMVLTISHAWCIGLVLYAAQAAAPYVSDLGLEP